MFDWLTRARSAARHRTLAAARPRERDVNAGEYHLLYKYLRDRYANRVVLTFAEIEDLLGFSLPEPARAQGSWWRGAAAVGLRSSQTHAWALAGRTATVNLIARSVVFERVVSSENV